MSYVLISLLLVSIAIIVVGLIDFFGNRKEIPWYAQATIFITWVFPFSIIFVLPLDLASTLYRLNCEPDSTLGLSNSTDAASVANSTGSLLASNGTFANVSSVLTTGLCDVPLAYVDEDFLLGFWTVLYWTMFNLTWFVIPIMQNWIRSGEFKPWPKLLASIKENIYYYAMVGAVGLVFGIYIAVVTQFNKDALMGIAMAGANAWGLLLCTLFLGYGLVEVPRGLWFSADYRWKLRHLEFQAPNLKESVIESEAELYEVARDVAVVALKVKPHDPLRPFVNKLLEKCPLASEERGLEEENDSPEITLDHIKSLHARIKNAVKVNSRNQAQFNFLLRRAFVLQDVIKNEKNPEHKIDSIFFPAKDDNLKAYKLHLYWLWRIWLEPIGLRVLSIICAVLSIAIVWSESTFQIEGVTLSIPAIILRSDSIGYGVLELVSVIFLCYMCTCAYSSLFKLKLFDWYAIVPQHHTDAGSLLFIGAYLCRLTFPLCYNVLKLVDERHDRPNSVFLKYQGQQAALTPLLGEGYNTWLPEVILILCILTLLNLHGRILRLFRVKNYFYETIQVTDSEVEEGREIISQARVTLERNISRGIGGDSFDIDRLLVTGGAPAVRSAPITGAKNAKDFLAKYKARAAAETSGDRALNPAGAASSSRASSSSNNRGSTEDEDDPNRSALFGFLGAKKGTRASPSAGSKGGRFQRLVNEDEDTGTRRSGAPAASSTASTKFPAPGVEIRGGGGAAGTTNSRGAGRSQRVFGTSPKPAPASTPAAPVSAGVSSSSGLSGIAGGLFGGIAGGKSTGATSAGGSSASSRAASPAVPLSDKPAASQSRQKKPPPTNMFGDI